MAPLSLRFQAVCSVGKKIGHGVAIVKRSVTSCACILIQFHFSYIAVIAFLGGSVLLES